MSDNINEIYYLLDDENDPDMYDHCISCVANGFFWLGNDTCNENSIDDSLDEV